MGAGKNYHFIKGIKFIINILLFCLISSFSHSTTFEDLIEKEVKISNDFSILIDGKKIITDTPPLKVQNKLYVPVRFISEHLGAQVEWFSSAKSVRISLGDRNIILWIGEKRADVSGELIELQDAPFIYQRRTYLPLRWTALSLGAMVVEEKNKIEIVLKTSLPKKVAPKNKTSSEVITKEKNIKYPKGVGWATKIWTVFVGKLKFVFQGEIVNNKSNKVMAPLVITLWIFSLFVLIIKWNTPRKGVYLFLLLPVPFFILFVSRSTYWATLVPVGTALVGMFSSGSYEDKIDIMSDTSPYLGLIITFLGLGEIVGPAIAQHNVDMIGYGIAIKIEASICGMLIRILIRTFFLKSEEDEEK